VFFSISSSDWSCLLGQGTKGFGPEKGLIDKGDTRSKEFKIAADSSLHKGFDRLTLFARSCSAIAL
jgi:hypothetical protein